MKTKKRKLNPKAMPLEMLKRRYFDWLVAEGMRQQKVRKFHWVGKRPTI